ncbi:uncharacterized protein LOC127861771 [Dreissena polymorpha]|uniref:uncharacterized protein LOC127861771 n=1 Tax=Dreissena polymorpha TaxID=45954 RepID=UPI002264BC67|nr:uncharacterized protein LOC127861771 [Dreissena polymorpha]
MADVGEHNLKIEKSTEVTQLEATAEVHVNKNGVLQLLEDDEIDEDELSHMKEEIENLKRQEEQLRKKQDFHETKKQLEKQKAKIESLKDRQMGQLGEELRASNRRANAEGSRKNLKIQATQRLLYSCNK